MTEEKYDWRLPNWRNPEEYEFADQLDPAELRWEFLRRNKDYQRDWSSKQIKALSKYGLTEWHDPSSEKCPPIDDPCHLVDFSERDPIEQNWHYEALASTQGSGSLIFSISLYHPIKPQLKLIEEKVEKAYKRNVSPDERRQRPNRKNNKNGRMPSMLLRVLDAHNEGIPVKKIAESIGGKDGISESATRRTLNFAKSYWKKFNTF